MQLFSRRALSRATACTSSRAASSAASDAKDRLIIFDTTLRDGEQSPGATLNVQEKLAIAKQLHSLGCDVIEAGFPIASPGDFHAVKTIAEEVGPLTEGRKHGAMTICGLSRAHEKDIETCFRALEPAPKRRIHTFLATSDIHLEHKLKISRAECITASAKAVAFAKSFTDDVEFSPEDAGRSDREFLVDVLGAVIEAGATTLNIPDTVGYCLPEEYAEMIEYLVKNVEGAENVVFSTHCHNDLGVATANTLEAVRRGARQAEVTINGIGERAGNTSLEEVVMAINTRPQWFPVYHDIDTRQIMRTSRMVSGYTGMMVQPNKAITGANAFAHEAGIHQDGVLKHQNTYEIMTPESVGLGEESNLVLGKHSGKAAFAARLVELGHTELTQEQINNFTKKFKDIADEKKTVTDADLDAVVMQGAVQIRDNDTWKLESVHVTSGNNVRATATVALRNLHDDSIVETATMGSGPVDAIYKSITDATGTANSLEEFSIQAITSSTDSLGRVTVRIESGDNDEDGDGSETRVLQTGATQRRTYVGHGQSMDILMASAEAHLSAINRLLEHRTYFEQMHKRRKAREVLGISAEAFNKLQSESLEK